MLLAVRQTEPDFSRIGLMRITFVVATIDLGGGIRVIAQYAEALRQRGHEVLVVSPAPYPYGRIEKFRNKFFPRETGITTSHFDATGVPVKFLERYRPVRASDVPPADFIIATWWETAEWIASFPDKCGVKVHFVQGYEIWNGQKDRVDASLRLPTKKITISSWLKDVLVDRLGSDQPKVIFNGVDNATFSLPRRQMPDTPTIGFVYSPLFIKGTDIAIAAITRAKERVPNLRGIAFGHKSPESSLALPDFVEYFQAPSQEEIRRIYGKCSAWLFCSREEGFGLPILEALACGTPVLAMPAGAAPDILIHGGGVLLESHCHEDMAIEIAKISEMKFDQWEDLSCTAEIISRNFSVEKSVNAIEKFLLSNLVLE